MTTKKIDPLLALSIDVDWAPDLAIDFLAKKLISTGVKATWFITHQSPAILRLFEYPELFETAIHPNFLPGSSHGKSINEVLNYCLEIVPGALTMRSHALFQSTPMFAEIMQTKTIQFDSSVLVSGALHVQPFDFEWQGNRLIRLPYIWEDDVELSRKTRSWDLESILNPLHPESLKIFDFHPVTSYLNSETIQSYTKLKEQSPFLQEASKEDMDKLVHSGIGVGTLLDDLIDHIVLRGGGQTLKEIGFGWI